MNMCKAYEQLSAEEKAVFDRIWSKMEPEHLSMWVPVLLALTQHAKLEKMEREFFASSLDDVLPAT